MIKIKKAFSKLTGQLKHSVKRFPEAICVAGIMVIVGIVLNHSQFNNQDNLERLLMVLAMGLPLFAAFKLIIERKAISMKWRIIADVLIVALLVGYYFLIPMPLSDQFMLRYITSMAILYMIFLLIPYFYKRKHFAIYCIKLIASFLVTYLYTLVLYLGLISIIFTVDQLFGLDIDSKIYLDLLFIATGIFGVTYFLGKLPLLEEDMTVEAFPMVFRVLIVSIIMPLITAYTVVLYAYFAKILIGWNWPQGLVGQLVVWYGLISMLTLFFIQDLGENSPWIRTYKRFFPFFFVLPLIMMFCAIGIRINQIGWTLPRYYVVLVGMWLLMMTAYYIVKRHTQSTFAILSAIILLIFSMYGPLSGFSTSIRSQSNRLEALLSENDMLVNGKIVAREEISVDKKAKISNIVDYLNSIDALEEPTYFPKNFDMSQMKEIFGFEPAYTYFPSEEQKNSFGYYYDPNNSISPVAGYNYKIDFAVYKNSPVEIKDPTIAFSGSIEANQIEITFNKRVLALQAIGDIAQELHTKLGNKQGLQEGDLNYTVENDKAIVVFILTNLYGEISNDEYDVSSMEGSVWVTLK